MSDIGHNNPPVELTPKEAKFVREVLERDIGQGLAVLTMVQEGKLSRSAAEKVVAYNDIAKPLVDKIRERGL